MVDHPDQRFLVTSLKLLTATLQINPETLKVLEPLKENGPLFDIFRLDRNSILVSYSIQIVVAKISLRNDLYDRTRGGFGLGIFGNLGIFIPGIGDFSKSGDLYPPGLGVIENLGFFVPRDFLGMGIFFLGWGIPSKSHLWTILSNIE